MKIVIIAAAAIIILTISIIIGYVTTKPEEKELTEQEKTMKALRILIYIIIGLILIGVIVKLLLWKSIISIIS